MKNSTKAILITFGLIILFAAMCSCSVQENVCTPHFGDSEIVEVTEKEVTTVNYLGYRIPHRISKNDTTTYIVGEILILNR